MLQSAQRRSKTRLERCHPVAPGLSMPRESPPRDPLGIYDNAQTRALCQKPAEMSYPPPQRVGGDTILRLRQKLNSSASQLTARTDYSG